MRRIARYALTGNPWTAVLLITLAVLSHAQEDPAASSGPERLVWRRSPLAIPLVVGEERLVHFPSSVSVGLPPSLTSVLRAQSINGTLYLLASAPFGSTRILVRSRADGPLYVLDATARPKDPQQPPLPEVEILPEDPRTTAGPAGSSPANPASPHPSWGSSTSSWGYVALTRHAAQQLYAPSRLLAEQPGVAAQPVSVDPVPLIRGSQVEASPVASWKAGALHVTAVKLTNRSRQSVVLDPRALRGAWLAATFQHNRLLPNGDEADTTAVYLVSDRPFAAAL